MNRGFHMAPRPPRSGRPGEAVAPLDIPRSGQAGARLDIPLAEALDPDQRDGVAVGTDGEANAVTGRHARGIERRGRATDGHHLHGPHAEARDGLVANEDEIGRGAGD